jgi:hypothetical protein
VGLALRLIQRELGTIIVPIIQSAHHRPSLHNTVYTVTAAIKNNGTVAGHEVIHTIVITVDVL